MPTERSSLLVQHLFLLLGIGSATTVFLYLYGFLVEVRHKRTGIRDVDRCPSYFGLPSWCHNCGRHRQYVYWHCSPACSLRPKFVCVARLSCFYASPALVCRANGA